MHRCQTYVTVATNSPLSRKPSDVQYVLYICKRKVEKNLFCNPQLHLRIHIEPFPPLLPDPLQLGHIQRMHLVHVPIVHLAALGLLHDLDRSPGHDVHRLAVRHESDVVIEDAARVEQGDGEADPFLDQELPFVDQRVRVRGDLVVEVVFAESEDGDQVGARADGEFDEAFAALEHEPESVRLGVEGFPGSADDDGDGAAHAFVVGAAFGEDVLAGFAGDGSKAHGECPITVKGDAEIGVESEEGVCDAGEELLEAEGFGRKGGEGAVGDLSLIHI